MFTQGADPGESNPDSHLIAQFDGAERVPLLPEARFITLAPSTDPDEPVDVTIEWSPSRVEKPLPGSTLWRAVLENRLAKPVPPGPAERLIRHQIRQSLERFPDLESWWGWIRTGWTAPPKPDPVPDRAHGWGAWLRRLRRR